MARMCRCGQPLPNCDETWSPACLIGAARIFLIPLSFFFCAHPPLDWRVRCIMPNEPFTRPHCSECADRTALNP